MSYAWAGKYELLAEIEGGTQYLVTTGETYDIIRRPDDIDPNVLVNGTTQTRVEVLQVQAIIKNRD